MRILKAILSIPMVAASLAASATSPARATDEGGTQSVFAYGAGNRGLSMGSAFVAAADDASAMYWNPAGLGLITRNELHLSQSWGLGPGFQESYVATAMPNWRWGTFGFTLRHFGVRDIDRRDERNVALGDDASDSEVEMALGYGRSFGTTWTLGGVTKLQRQSVAGFSGSGLGVDLGVGARAPWTKGVRLGLAVRNAMEPTIRLDRESVPDPMTVRTGIAYEVPLPHAADLLVEVDVEKPRGGAEQLHAGMEYRFMNMASLRLGLNGGELTGGSSIRWNNLSFDYAFENNALAFAQRAGLSMRFGATVEESRLAARRAEDEELQRRLAEAFQLRQARQIEELLARGEELQSAGQLDEALETLSSVLTLEPGNAVALARQVQVLGDKAALLEQSGDYASAAANYDLAHALAPDDTATAAKAARCRAESDLRAARTAEIRALFASAMDALAAENFIAARDRFADVLVRDPGDSEAARMLARTRQALARRAARLVDAAHGDIQAGRLGNAASSIDEATKLDPHAAGLEGARTALVRARQVADTPSRLQRPAGNTGSGVSIARRSTLSDRQIEQLYTLGLNALQAQRTEEAMRYWELVWTERPAYREVGDMLKREYLARGMESFAAGRLEEAVLLWEKVLRIDPNDARAMGYLARARQQIIRSREIFGVSE